MNILDDLDDCLLPSPTASPTHKSSSTVLGKRNRSLTVGSDSDENDDDDLSPSPTPASTNTRSPLATNSLTFAKSMIAGKRFKQSQVEDIEKFAQVKSAQLPP